MKLAHKEYNANGASTNLAISSQIGASGVD